MSLLDAVRYRLRALLNPTRHDRDLLREMDFHLELDAEHRERDSRGNLSHDDARLDARKHFGNVARVREEARAATAIEWLNIIARDVRFATRSLRRTPIFTIGVVLTLALGVGATAAMFTLIDRLLFRPPPQLLTPERVHRIYAAETIRGKESIGPVGEYARYVVFATRTSSFDRVAGFTENDLAVGTGDAAREMRIGIVSASFFGFFDTAPVLGRYFGPSEDVPGRGVHVVVASYTEWQAAYGGRTDILGTKVRIGPDLYEIIGVANAGFVGLWPNQRPAYYIPIATYGDAQARAALPPSDARWWTTYHWGWMGMIARTKPGVRDANADADLTQAMVTSVEGERAESPATPPTAKLRPYAIAGSILTERGPDASGFAMVAAWLGGMAAIVLIIATANVCNLLITRAIGRRREIALRLALGVSRMRLLSQLFTESTMLALAGGLAGLLVAHAGGIGLRLVFLPTARPLSVLSDARTLTFGGVTVAVVGLVIGLAPMLYATRSTLADDLKSGMHASTYRGSRLRFSLLVAQCALSVVLLVGAGLFVRSLSHVRGIRLGYDVDPVLVAQLNMRGVSLDSVHAVDLRRRLVERARSTPGVLNASLQLGTPFWDTERQALYVEGIDSVARLGRFDVSAVSPEYFATFGTRILRGRGLLATDRERSTLVMVVSQKMGATLWPGADALGKCVRVETATAPCRTVVGVAEDIKSHQLGDETDSYYYVPAAQFRSQNTGLFVRVAGDGAGYADAVRRSLQREMPNPAYVTVTPFADIVGEQVRSWKLGASMFTAFGLLALVLAAIGLYSVIAYSAAERRREMGIRVALGAQRSQVIGLVVRAGVGTAVAGVAIGAAIAFAGGPRLAPLLFDESPRDAAVYLIVAAVMILISIMASWLPAARASRIDPTLTLRYD